MYQTDYLKFSFFAQHFNVPEKLLCWGIMIESEKDPEPALLIDGTSEFIAVLDGKFYSPMNSRGHKIAAYPAEQNEESGKLILKSNIDGEDVIVKIEKELITDIYSRRWFQDSKA